MVDPICLGVKMVERRDRGDCCDCCDNFFEAPECICSCFNDDLVVDGAEKRLYATLGQFSIIRLERDTQLLMDSTEFCMPEKECIGSTEDEPCDLFKRIRFPVDEFFPPDSKHMKFAEPPTHKDCCR